MDVHELSFGSGRLSTVRPFCGLIELGFMRCIFAPFSGLVGTVIVWVAEPISNTYMFYGVQVCFLFDLIYVGNNMFGLNLHIYMKTVQ